MSNGFIYIMSNEIFKDGRLKIGMSNSDPSSFRKDQLYTTGVPEPFKVEYFAFVEDYENVERKVHQGLDLVRPNKDREFFQCTVPEAISTIRSIAKIKYEEVFYVSPEEIERLERKKDEQTRQQKAEAEKRKKEEIEVARQEQLRKEMEARDYINAVREKDKKENFEQWFTMISWACGIMSIFFISNSTAQILLLLFFIFLPSIIFLLLK